MMRALVLAFFIAFLLACSAAFADEETDTRAPSATPTPSLEVEVFALRTWGAEARSKELFREPESFRWSARFSQAFHERGASGVTSIEMSSAQTGRFGLQSRFSDGGTLAFRFSRDRRVEAFRLRVPFETTEDLGASHERLDASYDRPLVSGANGGIDVSFRRVSGLRPALTADPITFAPSSRRDDARNGSVAAHMSFPAGPAQVRLETGFREDALRRRLDAPGLDMRSSEVRQTTHADVRVEGPSRSALLVGGGWRIESIRGEPTGGRTLETGSFESGDVDLEGVRQRVAIGAAFLPVPRVRTGVSVQASSTRFRGTSTEARNLATPQSVDGRSRQELLSADALADAEWAAPARLTLLARGRASFRREDARWAQTFSTSGGSPAGRRVEDLVRERAVYTGELGARTAPIRGIRFGAGARLDSESSDVDVNEAVDTRTLGARERRRATIFASARARPSRMISVDARVKGFRETRTVLGTEPTREGFEARLRASGALGPIAFFGSGAYGDDRYELSPISATDLAGYAPVELAARSWIGSAGVAAAFGRVRASASASHVAMANDLRSELSELGGDVSTPVGKTLRLSARARWLQWRDPRASWEDGSALGGAVVLAGSF